jgi:hypothetical protein
MFRYTFYSLYNDKNKCYIVKKIFKIGVKSIDIIYIYIMVIEEMEAGK